MALAPYAGKGTGETTLLRQMYGSLSPGDVVVADALFDNYFLIWELRGLGIDVVVREAAERAGARTVKSGVGGDLIVWPRPNKPREMSGEQYRTYPKCQTMRRVSVDAGDKNNRVEQFRVVTTILDESIGGGQIGDLYERRWQGELDLRSIKSVMKMDVLRCKSPEMVGKEIRAHLLAYNLLRTVMAVAAAQSEVEPRQISFKGAKQAVTAFAPKIEAARPRGPRAADRRPTESGRLPPRRTPAGPMGAACAEAEGQTGSTPDATAGRH